MKGTLTISRRSDGKVAVQIRDEASRITFAVAELEPAQFSEALFGLANVEANLEVQGLQYVGKTKETRQATVRVSYSALKRRGIDEHNRTQLEKYLTKAHRKEGWLINPSLGSQGSRVHRKQGLELNFSYYRYV